ncbi:hypothetical protein [Desulfurobacterium sp.]
MRKILSLIISILCFSFSSAKAGYKTMYEFNKTYMSGRKSFVIIGYSASNEHAFNDCRNIEIGVLTYRNYLRHGYSFLFGWKNFESDGIRKIDFTYNFILQFPFIGANREIIAIGNSFTLVPFLGIGIGGGLRTDNFPDVYKFSDTGDWFRDTIENYVVARVKTGFDLTVAPGLAFQFMYSKNLTMDKASTVWAGINVDF